MQRLTAVTPLSSQSPAPPSPSIAPAQTHNVRAYFYLKKYGAWDFLNEHWWALHTDSTFYAVRDLYEVCFENGGLR